MKLKWSLIELQKNQNSLFPVNGQADLKNSLMNRNSDILDVDPVDVAGSISMEGKRRYYVDLTLAVAMTLPSSRSLEPVVLDMDIPFHEIYLAPGLKTDDFEDLEEDEDDVFSLEKDILDLQKPIEDTILAAIPMKILSKEEEEATDLPNGQDWNLVLEEDADSQTMTIESDGSKPSPFDVLKEMDLFDADEEAEE